MPYLSRIWLNPLRPRAQRFLHDPHTLHAAVLGGLSRQPVIERVLWRLETGQPHRMSVLVLTQSRPSWEHLVEQAGWPGAEDPQTLVKSYQPLLDLVMEGREFAFRLTANPTSSTKALAAPTPAQRAQLARPRPRGVRVAHRTVRHQLEWFLNRISHWGFTPVMQADDLPAVQLVERGRLDFAKPRRNGDAGRRVVLHTATFTGLLRVEDVEAARTSLLSGVGPGKAYGLGLLTLAPPRMPGGET